MCSMPPATATSTAPSAISPAPAVTAVTAGAGEISMGACDVGVAGGIEHMGHHPMGEDVDFNPRFVAERLVDTSAVTMGATAENLHDKFPQLAREDADRFAVASQRKAAAAWDNGVMSETVLSERPSVGCIQGGSTIGCGTNVSN